ncbi:hypothetical protein N7462_011679 [Penicillium macrosclerotiorum]|uniref:uncharacterized protein n=1 Tax=Penicillium macrosclerotiorum TaxID=303699 RepID=UPI0025473349|nr:uncharacterized protein N7462_011679 [Penicillium macrosclerotiorum]KAJ5662753.1 hypothetical protein N7462_011679 [Penicillium macrosclerotiorum]
MRFLKSFVTFSSLFLVACAAPATQKDSVISSIARVSQAVQVNKDAINHYQGGSLAAIPVGRKNYDCWYALREAHSKLTDTKFTPSESKEVVKQFSSLNQDSMDLLDLYREKAPLLNQASVSFLVPIMMQALFREADDYSVALQALMPQKDIPAMKQITVDHKAAWDEAFAAYDPTRNTEPVQQWRSLISVFSPALTYIL